MRPQKTTLYIVTMWELDVNRISTSGVGNAYVSPAHQRHAPHRRHEHGDLVTEVLVQAGELRELGNVLQPGVRDLVTAIQVLAGELRELSNMRQPRVRDFVTVIQVQAGELREFGNALKPRVRDLALFIPSTFSKKQRTMRSAGKKTFSMMCNPLLTRI